MFSDPDQSVDQGATGRAFSTLATDVSQTTDLLRQMREMEMSKNREIEQLQSRNQVLTSKVMRLEEALNVAVRALDEETAVARFHESTGRKRVLGASMAKWKAKYYATRLSRLESASREFEASVAATVAEGSVLSSRGASTITRTMEDLALSEKSLVEERHTFLSRTAAAFTTLGVESVERYLHAAKVFSDQYETVVKRRLGLITAYVASATDSERSCAALGSALNKFRDVWGRQKHLGSLSKTAVELATERTAELSGAAGKFDVTRDSFGSLVTILAVPPLLTVLRQALQEAVSSARERRGNTSAFSSVSSSQAEELSIVNATHLVAASATQLFDVLESFLLQQPMTLQAAEAFRGLVNAHLHPNSVDPSQSVFTLQPVVDLESLRYVSHDHSEVPALVRSTLAQQKQQSISGQWRSTPFDWSLIIPATTEDGSDSVPILARGGGAGREGAKYVSPPRRMAVPQEYATGESPADSQRAKELIARLRQ